MKKVALVILVILGGAVTGFSQVEKNKTEKIKLVPIEKSENTNSKKMTPQEEISYCNTQIEALDNKEAWIRSNPDELKLANENGWFTNADKNRAELRKRINELKK